MMFCGFLLCPYIFACPIKTSTGLHLCHKEETKMGCSAIYHGLPSSRYFVLLYLPMSASNAEATVLTCYFCLVINCCEHTADASKEQNLSVTYTANKYGASARFHAVHQFETVRRILQSVRLETPRCLLLVTTATGEHTPEFQNLDEVLERRYG
jgi:hypothetical protein